MKTYEVNEILPGFANCYAKYQLQRRLTKEEKAILEQGFEIAKINKPKFKKSLTRR